MERTGRPNTALAWLQWTAWVAVFAAALVAFSPGGVLDTGTLPWQERETPGDAHPDPMPVAPSPGGAATRPVEAMLASAPAPQGLADGAAQADAASSPIAPAPRDVAPQDASVEAPVDAGLGLEVRARPAGESLAARVEVAPVLVEAAATVGTQAPVAAEILVDTDTDGPEEVGTPKVKASLAVDVPQESETLADEPLAPPVAIEASAATARDVDETIAALPMAALAASL